MSTCLYFFDSQLMLLFVWGLAILLGETTISACGSASLGCSAVTSTAWPSLAASSSRTELSSRPPPPSAAELREDSWQVVAAATGGNEAMRQSPSAGKQNKKGGKTGDGTRSENSALLQRAAEHTPRDCAVAGEVQGGETHAQPGSCFVGQTSAPTAGRALSEDQRLRKPAAFVRGTWMAQHAAHGHMSDFLVSRHLKRAWRLWRLVGWRDARLAGGGARAPDAPTANKTVLDGGEPQPRAAHGGSAGLANTAPGHFMRGEETQRCTTRKVLAGTLM